jgi:hypothetical protein
VFDGDRLVAAYTLGHYRPYVYPVLTPGGLPVTEESPADHPHHHSVWLGQDDVNGANFWLNRPGCGRVSGEPPEYGVRPGPDGPAAVFWQRLSWIGPDGVDQLLEERATAITPTPAATLVDVLSERRPASGSVELGMTKEAGFGVRVLDQLDEEDGGTLVNNRGDHGETGTFDQDAEWVDYSGLIGGRAAGIAILPHPGNARHPWFTRAYGLVLCNQHRFGRQVLEPGQALRLQWRVAAHDGAADQAGVARV